MAKLNDWTDMTPPPLPPSSSPSSSPSPARGRRGRGLRVHLAALAFFTALTILMTYPLVLRMGDSLVGEIGDNIYFVFLIRWYEKAWFELGISPFFHPWLNYPQGWNLASTDTSLATTLFGLPASLIAGPVFGYNFAMLVTFVFSGWAMFYWVRRITSSVPAGLIAGAIYAFLPNHMAHFLIGHLNLSGTQWFPLYFMGLYNLLTLPPSSSPSLQGRGRGLGLFPHSPPLKTTLITALMLGLIAFTSMYYLYLTLIISVIFVGAYLLLVDRPYFHSWGYWRNLALRLVGLAAASLPLVALAVMPFLGLNSQGGLAERTVSYASMYSASPTDFFLPSTDHFLWGAWVGAHFDRSLWIEATLYIGAVTLILAALPFLPFFRMPEKGPGVEGLFPSPLIKLSLIVILISFILALGTDFHWNNQRVELPLPAALQPVLQRESVPIPLPALLLFRYLPFYSKMRAIMRIGVFVLIFSTLLAGIGAAWLLHKAGPRCKVPLTALLIALVLLDFYPGPYTQFARVQARPVDEWLARQPGQGAVAQFPFIQSEDQDQVYNTLVHQKPFIGGFFSANQPEQYLRIRPILETFPSEQAVALLKSLKVQWVLLDTRYYAQSDLQLGSLGLRYIDTIGQQAVFELEN